MSCITFYKIVQYIDYLTILDDRLAEDFQVTVDSKEVTLPNDTVTLKAICDPAMTTKRGWMYRFDWKIDETDKHPPKLEYDKNKPDEAQVSRLKEGVHIISVTVSCSKRSEIEGDNEEENIGFFPKCVSAEITVKSGNSVQNFI